jgi:hypothetical protein
MCTCLAAAAFFTSAAAQQATSSNAASSPAAGSQHTLTVDATKIDPNKCPHIGPFFGCELKAPDLGASETVTLKLTPKQFKALTQ